MKNCKINSYFLLEKDFQAGIYDYYTRKASADAIIIIFGF